MNEEKIVRDVLDSLMVEYLLARIGGRVYAFEKEDVREVIHTGRISRVPLAPEELKGMTFHSGMIVPVFDLSSVLAGGEKEDYDKIMIVGSQGLRAGILVRGVPEMVEVSLSQVVKGDEEEGRFISSYVKISQEHVPCVNVAELLNFLKERMR